MAQNIILKRSALPGKVPSISSLNIGEVAVNTYDGKLFIKRSGSIESIEEVITTNTTNTGSITLTQTGSFGELIVSNDVNIQRDLYVTRDIVGNGSIDILGDITGSSALLSGSLIVSGTTTITDNLTVLGEVNARQFNISVISSSILFESGSSIFGNTSDDTHDFTGSVGITGSLYLNGVELGGSSNSGSFTGSFSGDGSGLRGVVSDDLPIDGWDYESNSSASISEFNNESRKYIIDFQWEEEVGTPIGFKTFISNVTGSSQIVPTEEGIKFIVGNQQVALVGPNGIESVTPAGTVSGSSQLTSSYDVRYVLSGSITQTTWDNIASKPNGIVSGSEQVISILNSLNSFTASNENTSLNSFTASNENTSLNSYTASNDILNSLQTTRIDQLSASTSSVNQFTASNGNTSLNDYTASNDILNSLQTTRIDQIALHTASLNTYTASNEGRWNSFFTYSSSTDSRLNNLESKSASVDSSITNINSYTASVKNVINVIGEGTSSVTTIYGNLVVEGTTITVSASNLAVADNMIYLNDGNEITDPDLGIAGNYNDGTYRHAGIFSDASDSHTWKVYKGYQIEPSQSIDTTHGTFTLADFEAGTLKGSIAATNGVVSGSSQVIGILSSLNTYTGSNDTTNITQNSRLTSIESATGSYETKGRSIVSGSSQIDVMSTTNITRLATTGSNSFIGNQSITGSGYVVHNLRTLSSANNSNYQLGNDSTANGAGVALFGSTFTTSGQYRQSGAYIYSNQAGGMTLHAEGTNSMYLSTNGTTAVTINSSQNTTFAGTINATRFISNVTNNYGVVLNRASTSVYNGMSLQTAGSVQWFLGMRENLTSNNYIAYSEITQADVMTLNVSNNNATFAGTITENSSLRYKENIETINNGLDKVLQMRGVTYDKKNTGVKELGVIAEEIYEILPEVVLKNEEGEVDSVSYGRITAVLIEAIKDLKKEIEDLKANR